MPKMRAGLQLFFFCLISALFNHALYLCTHIFARHYFPFLSLLVQLKRKARLNILQIITGFSQQDRNQDLNLGLAINKEDTQIYTSLLSSWVHKRLLFFLHPFQAPTSLVSHCQLTYTTQ